METTSATPVPYLTDHPRRWWDNRYVYPVISRRSRGLSVGVNLNPDQGCNFHCVYCQVDRGEPRSAPGIDLSRLQAELENMVDQAATGTLFREGPFVHVPAPLRVFRDIAFSGDGEPTLSPQLTAAVRIAAQIRQDRRLSDVQLRLLTNASLLDQPPMRETLELLNAHDGEIWAKLDAGSEDYFRTVHRVALPLARIVRNILEASRIVPVVIQSLWMNLDGREPPAAEIDAFARRLQGILQQGGRIRLVQIYTTARQTAEPYVFPLSEAQLEKIAARIRATLTIPIEIFGVS